jgi:hypothetical protein
MHGGQELVAVAQMVFAELAGRIAERLSASAVAWALGNESAISRSTNSVQ